MVGAASRRASRSADRPHARPTPAQFPWPKSQLELSWLPRSAWRGLASARFSYLMSIDVVSFNQAAIALRKAGGSGGSDARDGSGPRRPFRDRTFPASGLAPVRSGARRPDPSPRDFPAPALSLPSAASARRRTQHEERRTSERTVGFEDPARFIARKAAVGLMARPGARLRGPDRRDAGRSGACEGPFTRNSARDRDRRVRRSGYTQTNDGERRPKLGLLDPRGRNTNIRRNGSPPAVRPDRPEGTTVCGRLVTTAGENRCAARTHVPGGGFSGAVRT